jgi:hypothetical protein
VKVFHRGNELRKTQLLQAPPSGQVWTSYYFTGSVRIAMRVQVNGSADQVYYLLTDHLGSTTVSYRSDGAETTYTYAITLTNDLLLYAETSVTDGNGHSTLTWSDVWGRVKEVIPPTGPGVSYAYDAADRLVNTLRGGVTTTQTVTATPTATPYSDIFAYTYRWNGKSREKVKGRGQPKSKFAPGQISQPQVK